MLRYYSEVIYFAPQTRAEPSSRLDILNPWACSYYGELYKCSQLIHRTRQSTAYIYIIPLLYDLLWKIAEEIFLLYWAVVYSLTWGSWQKLLQTHFRQTRSHQKA